MQLKVLATTVAIGAGALLVAAASGQSSQTSASATPPTRAGSALVEPAIVSPGCQKDARRRAACGIIESFFRALNSGRFTTACTLLGVRLRGENRGLGCPRFLSAGYPEPMPWGILGARRAGSGVSVLVMLGQSELDHIRMRHHRAYVDVERGRMRILETRVVR
jgi:hypothetical protein